jgi:hypothetical protein
MKKIFHLLVMTFLFFTSCNLAPGSYPYTEIYEFNVSEDKLIEGINKFKIDKPDFYVPEFVGLNDGRSKDKTDHWYHVWFYYKKENKIIYTWIRGINKSSKFAFVAINEGLKLGNWQDINNDFPRRVNMAQKEKFEKFILNEIKKYIQ